MNSNQTLTLTLNPLNMLGSLRCIQIDRRGIGIVKCTMALMPYIGEKVSVLVLMQKNSMRHCAMRNS